MKKSLNQGHADTARKAIAACAFDPGQDLPTSVSICSWISPISAMPSASNSWKSSRARSATGRSSASIRQAFSKAPSSKFISGRKGCRPSPNRRSGPTSARNPGPPKAPHSQSTGTFPVSSSHESLAEFITPSRKQAHSFYAAILAGHKSPIVKVSYAQRTRSNFQPAKPWLTNAASRRTPVMAPGAILQRPRTAASKAANARRYN